jgi:hypothetical protein
MRGVYTYAGRVGITVGIGGSVICLAASPALAASSLSVSPNGTVTSNTTISATGSDGANATAIGQSRTLTLALADPNGDNVKQWTSGSVPSTQRASVKGSFDSSNPSWSAAAAINGTYTFALKVNSSVVNSATVTLRIRAAKVAGFGGSASGTVAHFTWNRNAEPDLAGYDLVDVTDSGSPRDLTPGGVGTNVCDSSGCSVDIDFGAAAQGTSRQFVINALRYTSPSHSSTISSDDSAPATVSFPAPPPPSSGGSSGGTGSTGGGSAGGGSGGGTGGSTGGSTGSTSGGSSGSTTGGRTSGGSTRGGIKSGHPGAALKAYLPSFSAAAAPDLPSVVTEVKPLPEGTYKPTLAYPDQVVGETVHKQTQPVAAVRDELVRVLNVGAVWKSLAGAVLVLLMAAHLRAWVAGVDGSDS